MRTTKFSAIVIVCMLAIIPISGCGPSAKELKIRNDAQSKRIAKLESELKAETLKLEQLQRQLNGITSSSGVRTDALQQQIKALEEDLAKKKALIASMQQQLIYGGAVLPVELSTMLEDFAKKQGMVTYDAKRGLVKFESDLLFEKGSDVVASTAAEAVKALCGILNSEEGKQFDIIIAGHTDDMRIAKPSTLAQHPTNWHLSAHRAISVLNVMAKNNIDSNRMSVRGFGEFRPMEENKPEKKGNPKNRRVEIYIVAKGV